MYKTPVCTAGALTLWILAGAAAADTPAGGYGHHMWSGGWMGWIAGPVMMAAMLAIVAVFVVLVVRWLGSSGHGAPPAPPGRTPLDILGERYARGEIDTVEYEERRKALDA